MPFSHHSHSGEFCGHATGKLEEMVQTAISKKMLVYALTEHMPRDLEDFYPEEVRPSISTYHPLSQTENHSIQIEDHPDAESLVRLMDNFYYEATRLKAKYGENIDLLVGFESEWIRSSSLKLIQDLLRKYDWDMFVGSVHHVNTVPIDFSRELYEDARKRSGGSDESLFEDYFDAQYEMMKATSPPIVGHFDVIRLLSDNPNASLKQWEGVWNRIERNLQLVSEYGGVLELNSSALRKGLYEPYPQVEICQVGSLFLYFQSSLTHLRHS